MDVTTMERIRLLIVDDHRLFRQGLSSLLLSEPSFELVGMAASGAEALRLAAELQPDVAIVDLQMPDTPGLQLIPQLLAGYPGLGIVVLTASEERLDLLAAIRAGARGYVLKNADADALFDVVRQVRAGGAALCDRTTTKVIEILRGPHPLQPPEAALTPREQEVVTLMVQGADNAAIANQLVISENTVKAHVSHILEKLGVKNRAGLVTWAARSGYGTNRVAPEKTA